MLAHVGDDEVADQAPAGPDVADGFADEAQGTRVAGRMPECSRCFVRGGHRAEGYHLGPRGLPSERVAVRYATHPTAQSSPPVTKDFVDA